jgi:erythronate-4-phosphate dehydrogenase
MKIVADENIPLLHEAFGPLGEVVALAADAIHPDSVRDADALLVRSVTPVNALLLSGSRVRFVATATIGTDHVDRAYLREHGIGFASAAGSNARSVTEYVFAAMTVLAAMDGFRLADKVLGVVGVGNIGSRVAHLAEALGMTVLRNDPPLARETDDDTYVPLEDLFEADVVTFHVPLTREGADATHHMIDETLLRRMACGAILINTSRGAVADTGGLKAAAQARHLRAMVIDVWEHEPQIDLDLLEMVDLATPHIAGYSYDGKVNGTRMVLEALCKHFGVERDWDPGPHMPPPRTPRVVLRPGTDPQEAMRQAIVSAYDIQADDERLRGISDLPPSSQGDYFKSLRRDYPVRREFPETTVEVAPEDAETRAALEALRFTLA